MDHDVIVMSLSVLKGIKINKLIRRYEYNDENYFMVGFYAWPIINITAVAKITYSTLYIPLH